MVTDYLLATAAFAFAALLLPTVRNSGDTPTILWIVGFLVSGIAAAAGGTYHGLDALLTEAARGRLWNATVALMGASGGFLIAAVIASAPDPTRRKALFLYTGLALSLAGFAVQLSGVALNDRFDHNDLYHCVQIGALYLFYRAAKLANSCSPVPAASVSAGKGRRSDEPAQR